MEAIYIVKCNCAWAIALPWLAYNAILSLIHFRLTNFLVNARPSLLYIHQFPLLLLFYYLVKLWWIIMFPEKQRMVAKFSSCSQKSTYKFCINPSFSYCRGWACYRHPLMVGMEHQVDVLVEFLLKRPSELKFQSTNILM